MSLKKDKLRYSKVNNIVLNSDNTYEIEIGGFGIVGIKYLSWGDNEDIMNFLDFDISNREFVLKVLFNQILNSDITYKRFKQISDEELERLLRFFLDKIDYSNKYFKDTGDFFGDFREVFNKEKIEHIKEAAKLVSSLDFSVDLDAVKKAAELVRVSQLHMEKIAKDVAESLGSMFSEWQKIIEYNQSIFDNFKGGILDKQKREFLLQNGWLFTPYLRRKSIEENIINDNELLKRKNSEINGIYENFFSDNNYIELEKMIESWESNVFFQNRMNIFRDCLFVIKAFRVKNRNKYINPARMVLPLLISQIDGITSEYAKSKGLIIDRTKWLDSSGKPVSNKFNILWEQPCCDRWEILSIKMLEDYLFAKAFPYGQSNPSKNKEIPKKIKHRPFFQFCRHKIMHGEDLRFGSIDNVFRAFLVLDFLANLK